MEFRLYHSSINVFDLEKSLAFYEEALGLGVVRSIDGHDGSFKLRFLGNSTDDFQLELTWLAERTTPYNLGDKEFHYGFRVKRQDYETALAHHKEMGCVVLVNEEMGIYFIEDPDGYWLEIVPTRD
jgi:lactoylglutathione lyase